jgi:DNA-binding Xre family transcriptional regulator
VPCRRRDGHAASACVTRIYATAYCCQYPQRRILRDMSPISVTLKQAREAAGLTQMALANLADVRQATISELETGKTRRVDLDVLDRLCAVLKVAPGELLVRKPGKRRGTE